MQKIYIVRHGQSQANAEGIVAGQQDVPLSDLGKQQAKAAAKSVALHPIDTIVSSTMLRTRQTAGIIAEAIGFKDDIVYIPELIERGYGDLEGQTYDVKNRYMSGNAIDTEDVAGVEPIELFYERVSVGLDKLFYLPGKHILVVCHNGTGRMLMNIHKGGTPLDMYRYERLENAAVYTLE